MVKEWNRAGVTESAMCTQKELRDGFGSDEKSRDGDGRQPRVGRRDSSCAGGRRDVLERMRTNPADAERSSRRADADRLGAAAGDGLCRRRYEARGRAKVGRGDTEKIRRNR